MLANKVKQKLKKNQTVIGSWINLHSIETLEIMCSMELDFLTIDLEHSSTDYETMQHMIAFIEAKGIAPFVRVGENSPLIIKKALDAGAYGIIVPDIRTKDQAIQAIQSCYYPPKGTRGTGLYRAQGYGQKFDEYLHWYTENLCVILQIEHHQAISQLTSILSFPDIDATMIGPYDLSASLGDPGNFDSKEFEDNIHTYETVSKQCGIPTGYHIVHPCVTTLKEKEQKKYKFIAYGVDEVLFSDYCKQIRDSVVMYKINKK